MPEQPADEDLKKWHRHFAIAANNQAWTLAEKDELTSEEQAELLDAAHAAAHHWRAIGTPAQIRQANLLLGRAHALVGHGALAMKCATAALDSIQSADAPLWELAFAHAILANAGAAAGNAEVHARHYAEARALGDRLADPEDREIFTATFRLIPPPP
jgi:hypothetical protein